jgi:hypothetical protein
VSNNGKHVSGDQKESNEFKPGCHTEQAKGGGIRGAGLFKLKQDWHE